MITDNHTHTARPGAVVNVDPVEFRGGVFTPVAGWSYSAGIHPWNAGRWTEADMERLERLAVNPQVVAIGETGLDSVRAEAGLEVQTELLMRHVELSERTGKPLLLHVVRRFDDIMELKKRLDPAQAWVIHGFRGKPQLAEQLLRRGFYLSFGERFNPEAVAVTPPARMLAETDESELGIEEIVARLGVTPGVSLAGLCSGHCAEGRQA
ncbi:MAG: TatD family hydrolase [Duncaniella sp.]|nr:TatD family hydrolase [Duncaniella sp.]